MSKLMITRDQQHSLWKINGSKFKLVSQLGNRFKTTFERLIYGKYFLYFLIHIFTFEMCTLFYLLLLIEYNLPVRAQDHKRVRE